MGDGWRCSSPDALPRPRALLLEQKAPASALPAPTPCNRRPTASPALPTPRWPPHPASGAAAARFQRPARPLLSHPPPAPAPATAAAGRCASPLAPSEEPAPPPSPEDLGATLNARPLHLAKKQRDAAVCGETDPGGG